MPGCVVMFREISKSAAKVSIRSSAFDIQLQLRDQAIKAMELIKKQECRSDHIAQLMYKNEEYVDGRMKDELTDLLNTLEDSQKTTFTRMLITKNIRQNTTT